MDAVLDRLLLGDDLEPDPRTLTVRILDSVGARAKLVLGHTDRPVEVVPRVEAGRRWCDDIVQRLGPEVREQFGWRAVDHQLVRHGHLIPPGPLGESDWHVRSSPPEPTRSSAIECFYVGWCTELSRGGFRERALLGRLVQVCCVPYVVRFRDLSVASAMAVRSLGPVHDDECCLAIGHWLVAEQPAEGRSARCQAQW